MNNLKRRLTLGLALGAIGMTPGCAGYIAVAEPVGAVVVMREPPPPRREVIVMRPGPAYVWIDGYWGWDQRDYVWMPGRWAMPPAQYRHWERGRWQRGKHGWFFIEGHWR